MFAVAAVGAPCGGTGGCKLDPGAYETSTINIDNLSTEKKFAATVPHDRVAHGWDHLTLGDVDIPATSDSLYDLRITGGWPRELLTLSRSAEIPPNLCVSDPPADDCALLIDPKTIPWRPGIDGTEYYRLPGLATFLPMADYNRAWVRTNVRAARLIDHGACFYRIPIPDLAKQISDAFWFQWRNAGWKRGDTIGMPQSDLSASYIRDPGASSWTGNHDGFSMHLKLNYYHDEEVWLPLLPFPLPSLAINFESELWASYEFGMSDGLPTISPVFALGYDRRNKTAEFFNDLIGGIGAVQQVKTALREDLPKGFRDAVVSLATIPIRQPPPSPIGVRCRPAECSTVNDPPPSERCILEGKRLILDQLRVAGLDAAEVKRVGDGLTDDQFACRVAPDAANYELIEQKGECTFRPKFKRVNVLPNQIELVWYEQHEAPSPSAVVASTLGGKDKPICPGSGSGTTGGAVPVPTSRFAYPDQDMACTGSVCGAGCFSWYGADEKWRCLNQKFAEDGAGTCPGFPCVGPKQHRSCTERCGYNRSVNFSALTPAAGASLIADCCSVQKNSIYNPPYCCNPAVTTPYGRDALGAIACSRDPSLGPPEGSGDYPVPPPPTP